MEVSTKNNTNISTMDELAITFDLLSLQICKFYGKPLTVIAAFYLSANVYHFFSPETFTKKFNQPVTNEIRIMYDACEPKLIYIIYIVLQQC